MTAEPLAFLRAALDSAQARAEAATKGPWFAREYIDHVCDFEATISACLDDGSGDVVGHGYEGGGVAKLADAHFIVANNPGAVLRRIAADRKVLALHDMAHECSSTDWITREHDPCCWIPEGETCDTIRVLAEGWGWTGETT